MANAGCFKPLQGATFRVTKLDECGIPDYGDCGFAVSDGQTQIEITPNIEDGDRFLQKNAAGRALVNQQSDPLLNWFDYTITMAEVDPELFNIVTGARVLKDYTTPSALSIGNAYSTSNWATGRFALEVWMGTSEEACPTPPAVQAPWYGYLLMPFSVQGMLSDSITVANDLITFTLAGRTRSGTAWGVGPYDVMLNASGLPAPLVAPLLDDDHFIDIWTQLPPPLPECGCQTLSS